MNKSTLLLLVALVLAVFGHAADNSEAIIRATNEYVKKETAVKDPLVTVQKVADGYARVQVKSLAEASARSCVGVGGGGGGVGGVVEQAPTYAHRNAMAP